MDGATHMLFRLNDPECAVATALCELGEVGQEDEPRLHRHQKVVDCHVSVHSRDDVAFFFLV